MKKNILLLGVVVVIFSIFFICLSSNNDKAIIENTNSSNLNFNSNTLTMMYETEENSGEYQVSNDNAWPQEGYVFNERLSSCENGSTLTWDDENKKVLLQTNTSDKCYIYFDKEPDIVYLADYIKKNVYTSDGVNDLYYHDGVGTYGYLEAGDNSYRYSGANPNNYVCFGSDAAACPNDYLYRIIGVFGDQVKLIKSTSIGSYAWDADNVNTWDGTTKPDVYYLLNDTFYNNKTYIEEQLISKISVHDFEVGGVNFNDIGTAKEVYQLEIENQTGYKERMPIGLMYVSDYGYSVDPSKWSEPLMYGTTDYDINYGINNWLYLGNQYEWLITRISDINSAFHIPNLFNGSLGGGYSADQKSAIRPVFYLKSNVELVRGTGTSSDPYRIA